MEIIKKASWKTYLLGSVGLLGSIALHKSNILKQVKIEKENIKGGKFVYLEQKQSYMALRKVYSRVVKEISKEFKNPNNKCSSIYFDDPEVVENQNEVRSCIGYILDESESDQKINEFIEKNPDYKVKNIGDFEAYSTDWKLNFFSYFTLSKPYSYLVNHVKKHDKDTYNSISVTAGVYLQSKNCLKCILPVAASKDKLMISSYDKPASKK